jgi:hypothetical protein
MMEAAPVIAFPLPDEPDLVPGTRITVQSLPPPLNGRNGKVVDYDRASQAYIVHVDGGNPRTIYRENLRIMKDQSVPVMPVKQRAPPARLQAPRGPAPVPVGGSQIKPGDQILLCIEQHQFTLLEVSGIRRVCKSEPHSFAIAANLDDPDVPAWMRKPPPQAARPRTAGGKNTIVGGFRPGDAVYAVWDQDGRWYPGSVRDDVGSDKLEIEWLDKEALPSVVKRNMVCKRTTFEDLRNKPNYLGCLNLASRTGGMKGLKPGKDYEDEDAEDKEEEQRIRANQAAAELFGKPVSEGDLSQDEWNTVLKAMKVLSRFGVDGLVSSQRSEVFHIPPKFAGEVEGKENKSEWDLAGSSSLHSWLTEGQVSPTSLTLPPVSAGPAQALTAPSRRALEAVLARSGQPVTLPRGPLDIFLPPVVHED